MKLTLKRRNTVAIGQFDTSLYDQDTFYRAFIQDVRTCKKQLIIESPFITSKRVCILLPIFRQLREQGVQIVINTRAPEEHDDIYQVQAFQAVASFQTLGIDVLYTAAHHRKLAIVDNNVVWEGSLNILSFNDSCEIMRRMVSPVAAQQLLTFIGILRYLR